MRSTVGYVLKSISSAASGLGLLLVVLIGIGALSTSSAHAQSCIPPLCIPPDPDPTVAVIPNGAEINYISQYDETVNIKTPLMVSNFEDATATATLGIPATNDWLSDTGGGVFTIVTGGTFLAANVAFDGVLSSSSAFEALNATISISPITTAGQVSSGTATYTAEGTYTLAQPGTVVLVNTEFDPTVSTYPSGVIDDEFYPIGGSFCDATSNNGGCARFGDNGGSDPTAVTFNRSITYTCVSGDCSSYPSFVTNDGVVFDPAAGRDDLHPAGIECNGPDNPCAHDFTMWWDNDTQEIIELRGNFTEARLPNGVGNESYSFEGDLGEPGPAVPAIPSPYGVLLLVVGLMTAGALSLSIAERRRSGG